jgi:hypothetical protein
MQKTPLFGIITIIFLLGITLVHATTGDQLSLYYRFENTFDNSTGNATLIPGSGNGFTTASLHGSRSQMCFGTDATLLPTGLSITNFGTGAFTIKFLMNTTGTGYTILSDDFGWVNGGQWYVAMTGAGKVQYGSSGVGIITSTTSVNDGTTYDVVVTRASNNTVTMYVNGVIEATSTSNDDLVFDSLLICGVPGVNPLVGTIDDVTIIKGLAWNQTDVTFDYNGGSFQNYPVVPPPPVNNPPVMVSATVSAADANTTLVMSANSTDADGNDTRFLYTIMNNGVVVTSGTSNYHPQGVTVNFGNYSVMSNGNYSINVQADDGENLSANNITSNTVEITFYVPPPNTPPVMVSASVSVTNSNTTLVMNANATDSNLNDTRFLYTIMNNGVVVTSGTSDYHPQGVTVNFGNYTLSLDGNYSINVQADDGTNLSANNITSNTVEVTHPVSPPIPVSDNSAVMGLLVVAFLFIGIILYMAQDKVEAESYHLLKIIAGGILILLVIGVFLTIL